MAKLQNPESNGYVNHTVRKWLLKLKCKMQKKMHFHFKVKLPFWTLWAFLTWTMGLKRVVGSATKKEACSFLPRPSALCLPQTASCTLKPFFQSVTWQKNWMKTLMEPRAGTTAVAAKIFSSTSACFLYWALIGSLAFWPGSFLTMALRSWWNCSKSPYFSLSFWRAPMEFWFAAFSLSTREFAAFIDDWWREKLHVLSMLSKNGKDSDEQGKSAKWAKSRSAPRNPTCLTKAARDLLKIQY